eukprot:s147_g26.t1
MHINVRHPVLTDRTFEHEAISREFSSLFASNIGYATEPCPWMMSNSQCHAIFNDLVPLAMSCFQCSRLTVASAFDPTRDDADATLASPMVLGVADGVSQLEEFGMDASELPQELLRVCEDLGMNQLIPDRPVNPQDAYRGPVSLLKEAYEETESLGSTTILLAVLDNSTRIHGKLHPMVAVLTIGDCEMLMMRRLDGRQSPLRAVFHTEMQRIDGHSQTPLQLARVDDRVDPEFDEELALEVIERGSAVHCVSAYEGDIIVLGSDGVFDNLYLEEIVEIVNEALPIPKPGPFVWNSAGSLPGPAGEVLGDFVVQASRTQKKKKGKRSSVTTSTESCNSADNGGNLELQHLPTQKVLSDGTSSTCTQRPQETGYVQSAQPPVKNTFIHYDDMVGAGFKRSKSCPDMQSLEAPSSSSETDGAVELTFMDVMRL